MALTDSLISYWKLDEASGNAIDAHSTNDLTETSGTIGTATGKIGNARDFEGGDTEYFALADNADLSTGDIDFSCFCWVNAESLNGSSGFPVIANKSWGAGTNREWAVYQNGNGQPLVLIKYDGSATQQVSASTFGALSTATWYFVSWGHSASANDIWISINAGTPNTTSTSTGVMDATAGEFQIGASSTQSLYWDGLIDEFAFFKRDIRADLVTFYNAGAGLAYPFSAGISKALYSRRRQRIIGGGVI